MFIWVTPEEKILGNNFLKNNFILLLFLNLKEIFGIKYFLTKKQIYFLKNYFQVFFLQE